MLSSRATVWIVVLIAFIAVAISFQTSNELPAYILTAVGVVLAAWQIYTVLPSSGRIQVERQAELNIDDLIFFLYPYPGSTTEEIPRDFLLQLHVAVTNMGGRKTVLSRLDLIKLWNDRGQVVRIPGVPHSMSAVLYTVRQLYSPQGTAHVGEQSPLPLTLEPDDVLTLRLRFRRGIDWSSEWDLGKLAALYNSLSRPITSATLLAVWRSGGKVVKREFRVPIKTVQQEKYVSMLRSMTKQFTQRPSVPLQRIPIE